MEYFDSLPSDITSDILIRLPAESVLDCKLVCKNWRNLVRRPSFINMHLKHHHNHSDDSDSGKSGFIALTYVKERNINYLQYFEYLESSKSIDRIRRLNFDCPFRDLNLILGSCNGLICVGEFPNISERAYICNPITREFVMLPKINKDNIDYGITGFGYVNSTNEYKVVRLMSEKNNDYVEIYVYTLGSGIGWRNVGKINYGTRGKFSEPATFFNGNLYWVDREIHMIVTFDLAEEKFGTHLSPPLPRNDNFDNYYQLGVLDGCLSFAINRRDVDGLEYWDVWLSKKRNDNQSLGWSNECDVYGIEVFAVTKSRAVLTSSCNHIYLHYFEASKSKRIVDFQEHFKDVFPHRNTLVSLKELGEENTKIMDSIEVVKTEKHDQPVN